MSSIYHKQALEFENVNYFEHQNSIKYLFFTDRFLKGNNANNKTINNFNVYLNEENNNCPQC